MGEAGDSENLVEGGTGREEEEEEEEDEYESDYELDLGAFGGGCVFPGLVARRQPYKRVPAACASLLGCAQCVRRATRRLIALALTLRSRRPRHK
jgi:hypothetical protein